MEPSDSPTGPHERAHATRHERVVACVLGEMGIAERAAFLLQMAFDPGLRDEVHTLRRVRDKLAAVAEPRP